jgi:hypothetical protein
VASLPSGTRIGDFVIQSQLGRGGMGRVYRAVQLRLDRPVALKVPSIDLADDPQFAERFLREATIMRDLEHPSIVPVYDAGSDEGRLYLAMRLLENRTLHDLVQEGPLPPERVLALLRPLADALDHAHARGVIHRDLKPANILLDDSGRPYLADFGLAKALESASITLADRTLGTPRYRAPERATGPAGHRSDLYELGCVAFEMLTGRPPFLLDDPAALIYAHAHETPPHVSDIVPSLPTAADTVLDRALAKQPTDRFASAGEFVTALTRALAQPVGEPHHRPADDAEGGAARKQGRRRLPWLAAGGAALVVAAATTIVATTSDASDPAPGGASPASAPAASSFPPPVAAALPEPPVAHGAELYAPAFDGSGSGFLDSVGEPLDPVAAAIDHLPGALQMEAKTHGAYIYVQLDLAKPFRTYLADMELAVRPGSAGQFCWSLRWAVPGELAWYWCLDTATGTAEFRRFADGSFTPLGTPVPVPGLDTGRTVQVSLEVREQQLVMYLDGQQVMAVTDTQVPLADTLPGLELSTKRGTGLVRITGLRVWELPATGGT